MDLGALLLPKMEDHFVGVFTDGDLRRLLQSEGEHILDKK